LPGYAKVDRACDGAFPEEFFYRENFLYLYDEFPSSGKNSSRSLDSSRLICILWVIYPRQEMPLTDLLLRLSSG
jgi:hypothetical protein